MILRSARVGRGGRTSMSIVWPRSLWCHSTKSNGNRTHAFCRFDFLTTKSADGILGDSHKMLPASKSRMMTTAKVSQVGEFHLGKGYFGQLIRERRIHLLHPLVLEGKVMEGTGDESYLCSCVEWVAELSLCSTQFSLVVI